MRRPTTARVLALLALLVAAAMTVAAGRMGPLEAGAFTVLVVGVILLP